MMKKFLALILTAVMMTALFACGEASGDETTKTPESSQTTGSETTLSMTDSTPEAQTTEETTASSELTSASESTDTSASESVDTTASETTADTGVPAVNPDDVPVVFVTNGEENVQCYMTEQSPGTSDGFDLMEDFALLPSITGDAFSLVAQEERDDVFYGGYSLYDSEFEFLGLYQKDEELRLVDFSYENGTGTYYVRIAVNVGDPIFYTDAYYAWARLELTE